MFRVTGLGGILLGALIQFGAEGRFNMDDIRLASLETQEPLLPSG